MLYKIKPDERNHRLHAFDHRQFEASTRGSSGAPSSCSAGASPTYLHGAYPELLVRVIEQVPVPDISHMPHYQGFLPKQLLANGSQEADQLATRMCAISSTVLLLLSVSASAI